MDENSIARAVVDAAVNLHKELGPGLLESVYEVLLLNELTKRGYKAARQVSIPITFKGVKFEEGFRADIVVEEKVIVELKPCDTLQPVHSKQLLTYLKLADKRFGLLINFGGITAKEGIKRVVNGLDEKE